MARYNTNLHANKDGYVLAPGLDDVMTERSHSADPLDAPDTDQQFPVGTQLIDITGNRKFRYVQNGAVALGTGLLVQPPEAEPNHVNQNVAATAIAATSATVTLGATAATLDQYRDGFFTVNDGTGQGHSYRVKTHPAADASATCVITLYDGIKIALAASGVSEVSLIPSRYRMVIVTGSPATNYPIGGPIQAIGANEFFWAQTYGPYAVLIDGTPAINTRVINEIAGDDGGVENPVLTEAGPNTGLEQAEVGFMLETGVTNEYKQVFLKLDA